MLAGLGWLLFGYWWWLVLQRVSRTEVTFTGWFLLFSFFIIVTVTALWVLHNVSLFRRKGPRLTIREAEANLRHDTLGRRLAVEGSEGALTEAPVVRVQVDDGHKVYRMGDAVGARLAGVASPLGAVGDSE
jgi:hypothetical protein